MSEAPAAGTWHALGTSAVVLVEDPAALAPARAAVEAELDAIDRACSRFRDDSELARVNAGAGRPVAVGPLFMEALEAAFRASDASDGTVDPTIGEALRVAGYDRDFSLVGAGADVAARRRPRRDAVRITRSPGREAIRVDRERSTVAVPRGVRLDLGASAKALASDRAAAAACAETGEGVLVSLGGDIAACGPPPSGGWRVHVCEDHAAGPSSPGQTVSIHSGGLATSSTTVRRWHGRSGERHHIIDPSTGRPAEVVWRTVTVAAASCVDANTAATAAIVLGRRAPQWLRDRALPARLVAAGGDVLCLAGWPSSEEATR
jgi:thiamine biosynthesis lipoprotein